ncbi:DUF5671 domain-containing protein [Palleronia abyssalis]|uniref:DUF5671 domain-containing protein n=1 Tax=Palleronia abyssalis TaxID=1501240 RepID=A0A2R8BTP6_9RHOB|nr:DUF5671 domain-containing protein [Palleronia abyssalis]SPJ23544.1 hypothetical protein PAA8504_01356 [Palleronia abyssalis]
MAARAELEQFVRDALGAGHARDDIRRTMLVAGWRERDADRALAAFADVPFVPPVPRPRPFVSARDAAVYGLGFFALCVVVVNFVSLMFEVIESLVAGDPLGGRQLAWQVAAIVVFAPIFGVIDWRADRDSPVRKVLAYAALFFAALVVLFTLVSVIALVLMGGLSGEVALKALVVAGTAGGILLYYRRDLRADREI